MEIDLKTIQNVMLTALRGHDVLAYSPEKEAILIDEAKLKHQIEYLLTVTGVLK